MLISAYFAQELIFVSKMKEIAERFKLKLL